MGDISAAHLIYVPAVLVVGAILGWILGSRAAADAYAADERRRAERQRRERDATARV
jgi:hypothetical protein